MKPSPNSQRTTDELESALRTLNSIEPPDDLTRRVTLYLEHARRPGKIVRYWKPLALAPLAAAIVVLGYISVVHQTAPWRPVAPVAIRTSAPSRTITVQNRDMAFTPRVGGRRVLPAQPQPYTSAHAQPTVPFVYPQTREAQLQIESAAQARVTDRAVFDPRSDLETNGPK
jgi:hypothetical protein